MSQPSELVLLLSRTGLSAQTQSHAAILAKQVNDWSSVFDLAARFQVEPVFHANLQSLADGVVPPDDREESARRERDARAAAIAACLRTSDVVRRLGSHGIPTLVLKGASVGVLAYGDASSRTFGDIDLLVPEKMIDAARSVLLRTGYQPNYDLAAEDQLIRGGHALEFAGPASFVELHVSLVERHLHFDLDAESIRDASVEISVPGGSIRSMERAELFLFLCAHGTKHRWSRMRWICDLAQLADQLEDAEVARIVARARRAHATRILTLGVALIQKLFGSQQAFSALPPDAVADALAEQSLRELGIVETPQVHRREHDSISADAESLFYWVRARERLADKAACLATVVFTPSGADRSRGSIARVTRPVRLASNLIRRHFRARQPGDVTE